MDGIDAWSVEDDEATNPDARRCGGTGMLSYRSGGDVLGEACRGCIDCEGPHDWDSYFAAKSRTIGMADDE